MFVWAVSAICRGLIVAAIDRHPREVAILPAVTHKFSARPVEGFGGFPNAGYEPHPSCGDCPLTKRI